MKTSNFKTVFSNYQRIQQEKRAILGLKEYTASELPYSEKYCRLLGWTKDPKTRKWTESMESYCARTGSLYTISRTPECVFGLEKYESIKSIQWNEDYPDKLDGPVFDSSKKKVINESLPATPKQIATALQIVKREGIQSFGDSAEERFNKMTRKEISDFITAMGR